MDPLLYHAHHSRHVEDLPFWQHMAASQGGPVLELGCGTGRVLLPLAAEGHTMVGLDRDAGMLAYLESRLSGPDRPLLVQSDLRRFAFGHRFPLIILPCNTLSTLSRSDRRALFHCVRWHLAPQGWFVASGPNPAVLADLPSEGEFVLEEVFPHPNGGEEVQVSSAWERTEEQVTITWAYDRLHADGSVDHTTVEQSHDIIPIQSLQTEMNEAGLNLAQTYGDYDQNPYDPDAPYSIIVAGYGD